ncbi:MAG TPA: hypothetical protein VGM39_14925 [Kofleriaceae bacterium]
MWRCLPLAVLVACSHADSAPPPPAAAPPPVAAPAPPVEPALDLSGKWECLWTDSDAQGSEMWMVMNDGESFNVTLTGRDPGGRYTGSVTGTVKNRALELAFKYMDGTRGTMKLVASKNGLILDGNSTRAKGGAVSHYGCSRA